MQKLLSGYVEKVESEKDGILSVAIATDSSVDRDGEKISSDGWDFSNFIKNPVLLWAHDYRQEPVGKVLEIRKDGDRILFKPQFAVGISEKAKQIFEFYKQGFLNAFSVGFMPKEWHFEEQGGSRVLVFDKTELLEISAVPVPANANAIVLARGMGLDETVIKDIENLLPHEKDIVAKVMAELASVRTDISTLQKTIAGYNGTGGTGKDLSEKVDAVDRLLSEEGTKRLLQIIDKSAGEILRRAKQTS